MRIFIVENHADTLAYIRRHLEQAGHVIATAQTLAETLRTLPEASWDVLLTDLGLADGDGWSLLEQLGANRPPVAIAMSGHGSAEDRARSRAAGFQEHLTKPFLPRDLDRALRQAAQGDTA